MSETFAPVRKFVPAMLVILTGRVLGAEGGVILVIVGETTGVDTVIVVPGVVILLPALLDTSRRAVNVPDVGYV